MFYRGFYRYFGEGDKKGNIKRNEHESMSTRVMRHLCILNETDRCPNTFDIFDLGGMFDS